MPKSLKQIGPAFAVANTVLGALLLPGIAGIWVDHRYGSAPIGILSGFILGFFLAMYNLWKFIFSKHQKEEN